MTENKFHRFSSQFPTETKFGIDSVPHEVCYFLVRGSPGRSLVIYCTVPYLCAVAGLLKLAERKMTCLSLEKCVLLYRIFEKNKIVFSPEAYLSQ